MASAAVAVTNSLHAPFTFSFMRRGGGNKQQGKNDDAAAPDAAAASSAAVGAATTAASANTSSSSSASTTAAAAAVAAAAGAATPSHPYENAIKTICTVSTVEGFWETYDYLKRPGDLPTTTDYHFFRHGIKPTWEDPSNARGGKWIVRLPKGVANRYWEEIILALIGGQFLGVAPDEVCGAVLSVRYSEDILGVWNRSSQDTASVERIRDSVKKILQLPPHAHLEYKPHQNSIQDRSSFRNTQVWKPKSLEERRASSTSIPPQGSTGGSGGVGGGGGGGGGGAGQSLPAAPTEGARRSGSWTETTKPKRDSGRAWR